MTTTDLSRIEPSLATPLGSEPKPGTHRRRRTRRQAYSEPERIIALMVVSLVGVNQASKDVNIPVRTLYAWVDKYADGGGVALMREEACKALGHTMFATALECCREIRKRLADMPGDQLLDALKALSAGATVYPDTLPQASAAPTPAQVVVVVGNDRLPLAVEADNPQLSPEQETITVEASQPPPGGG